MPLRPVKSHPIDFVNPVFHQGLNITVRSEEGWDDRIRIGDTLSVDTGNSTLTFPVLGALHCQLREIPDGLLALEHDGDCRTLDGLQSVLEQIYGRKIPRDSLVTTLIFQVG